MYFFFLSLSRAFSDGLECFAEGTWRRKTRNPAALARSLRCLQALVLNAHRRRDPGTVLLTWSCTISLTTETTNRMRVPKEREKRFYLIQKIIKISCIFIGFSIQQSENIETPRPLALKSHNCSILLVLTV